MQRDEPSVRIAMRAYLIFWESEMRNRHKPQWSDFEKNSMYLAFVRFGRYVVDCAVEDPISYVRFLLRAKVSIDRWCENGNYNRYMRELTRNELPIDTLSRSFKLMESWATRENEDLTDFFRKIAPSQAVLWFLSGRISPLMLFVASSADDLLNRLTPEQKAAINGVIDEGLWAAKIKLHNTDIDKMRAELAAANI